MKADSIDDILNILIRGQSHGHRSTLIIEGEQRECLHASWRLLRWLHRKGFNSNPLTFNCSGPTTGATSYPSLNQHSKNSLQPISRSTIHSLLGRESGLLLFDIYQGLNPNLLAAACGTLRGGGLLLLLAPPLSKWQQFSDPEYRYFTDTDDELAAVRPLFLQRLQKMFLDASGEDGAQDTQNNKPLHRIDAHTLIKSLMRDDTHTIKPITASTSFAINIEEQNHLVNALLKGQEKTRVIVADRGRGKTIALARFIEATIKKSKTALNIVITAPQKAMIQPIFDYLREQQEETKQANTNNSNRKAKRIKASQKLVYANSSRVEYMAAANLADHLSLQHYDLLIVDEAAALPYDFLNNWLQSPVRTIFSTTTDGYEGTGNNFRVRFIRSLKEQLPSSNWALFTLKTPIRWAEHDPLEALLNRAFLLKPRLASFDFHPLASTIELSTVIPATNTQATETHAIEISTPCKPTDIDILEGIHSLLMLAHYRTTPGDFRQLLDAPNNHLFYITMPAPDASTTIYQNYPPKIIAALWAVSEGELPKALITAITEGKRRLKGHLLPQTLALHAGKLELAERRFLRIARIAVHPEWQNRGIGTVLIKTALNYAKQNGFYSVGTSFGETASLLRFWQRLGFSIIRRGYKRSPITGRHAVTLLNSEKRIESGGER